MYKVGTYNGERAGAGCRDSIKGWGLSVWLCVWLDELIIPLEWKTILIHLNPFSKNLNMGAAEAEA